MKKLSLYLLAALSLVIATPTVAGASIYHHWSETPPEVQEAHAPEVIQGWIDAYWEGEFVRLYWERVVAFSRAYEEAQQRKFAGPPYVQGIEVCNGHDLPPCRVVRRESGFDPNARNPRSTAWGLYQFLRDTWNWKCSDMPHGSATVAQQVECARRLWDYGRGSSHWALTL